jgi:hypothetical protein
MTAGPAEAGVPCRMGWSRLSIVLGSGGRMVSGAVAVADPPVAVAFG